MPLQTVSGEEFYLKTESKAKHGRKVHADGDYALDDDAECPLYCVPMTEKDGTYAEFQTYPSMKWKPARYSCDAIERYIATQFDEYVAASKKFDSTCDTEVKRRLEGGPPCWVKDTFGLPVTGGDDHICALWFSSDKKERSARLKGAVFGARRKKLWNDLIALANQHDSVDE
jgi:hypothetical protein